MYRLIRNTHLILGMSGVLFVLLYAVSAAQMAHRIRLTPQISEEDLALPAGLAARPLVQALGYNGEIGNTQMTPKGFRVTVNRPGTAYAITYDRRPGRRTSAAIRARFSGMLNRLHHQNGLHHEDGKLNAWGWALALVSITLLALGGTGVYMWFKLHTERAIGSVLLRLNLMVSLGLLAGVAVVRRRPSTRRLRNRRSSPLPELREWQRINSTSPFPSLCDGFPAPRPHRRRTLPLIRRTPHNRSAA